MTSPTLLSEPALAIRVSHLSMSYLEGQQVLKDVSIEVPAGQLVSLIGPNGAGKSTLLRCLVCLHEPNRGTIEILGRTATTVRPRELKAIRSEVGFVFQSLNLSPGRSVFANVLSGAASTRGIVNLLPPLAKRNVREDAMSTLSRLGIDGYASRRVDELSVGEQQRVAIARMLMQRPRVILADEPVSSLDPRASEDAMTMLVTLARAEGLTVVAAMHDTDLARRFTDRLIGLAGGTVRIDSSVAALSREQLHALYRLQDGAEQPDGAADQSETPESSG